MARVACLFLLASLLSGCSDSSSLLVRPSLDNSGLFGRPSIVRWTQSAPF